MDGQTDKRNSTTAIIKWSSKRMRRWHVERLAKGHRRAAAAGVDVRVAVVAAERTMARKEGERKTGVDGWEDGANDS